MRTAPTGRGDVRQGGKKGNPRRVGGENGTTPGQFWFLGSGWRKSLTSYVWKLLPTQVVT